MDLDTGDHRTVRRIYIRHAEKEYSNGDSDMYKHDPGITERGVQKSKMVAKYLIDKWGIPSKIISSPYKRTRETASVMKSVISGPVISSKTISAPPGYEKRPDPIKIVIDRDVSEYLGNHRNIPIDVTESTLTYDPPHPESFSEMRLRVRTHNDKITNSLSGSGNRTGPIWIVTHGLIIKELAALIDIKMARDFPSLTCLSILSQEKITEGSVIVFHDDPENISEELEECQLSNSSSPPKIPQLAFSAER